MHAYIYRAERIDRNSLILYTKGLGASILLMVWKFDLRRFSTRQAGLCWGGEVLAEKVGALSH